MDLSRVIARLNEAAWAIVPEKLEAIHALVARKLAGQNEPFEIKAQANKETKYLRFEDDGVAVIEIFGTLGLRMNVIERASGGVSSEILLKNIEQVAEDPRVRAIMLYVDSPGGTIDGTQELSDAVAAAAKRKPVYAYTDGMMASAAYWMSAGARKIFASPTAQAGSIGVVIMHMDYSGYDQKWGVKRTFVYNGKFKRLANNAEPLSEDGKAYLQEMVDGFYSIFAGDVAKKRRIKTEAILEQESKLFLAEEAVKAKLLDGVMPYKEAYRLLKKEAKLMTKDELKAEYPELVAEIQEEARKLGHEAGRAEGEKAERDRVTEILAAGADPEATRSVITEGVPAAECYKRFYQAEKEKKAAALKELETSAPQSVGQTPPKEPEPEKKSDLMAQAKARALEKKIPVAAALRELQAEDPDLVAESLPRFHVVRND